METRPYPSTQDHEAIAGHLARKKASEDKYGTPKTVQVYLGSTKLAPELSENRVPRVGGLLGILPFAEVYSWGTGAVGESC